MKAGERDDGGGAPTLVSVGLWVLDVTEIDDVNQRVSTDFLVYQSWKDSRLGGLGGYRFALGQIWSPQRSFLHSGRAFLSFPDRVTVGDGGKLQYV